MMSLLIWLFCLSVTISGVKCGFPMGYPQDWDYVTVREGAHMFWWLHETIADKNVTQRPLIIWLQGGPGASSTGYGNFEEFGPVDEKLKERSHAWIKHSNVLFIDNPVGTGYSYVDDKKYLTTNNTQIAKDLVEVLRGFYSKRPEFKMVPLHIFSQSYGGKMASEFGYELYYAIKDGNIESNLKSVALGNSWIDPLGSTLAWAPFLLQTGHVDDDGYEAIMKTARLSEKYFNDGFFVKSTDYWRKTEFVLLAKTFGVDFYNIMTKIPFDSLTQKALLNREYSKQFQEKVAYNLMVLNKRINLLEDDVEEKSNKDTLDDDEDTPRASDLDLKILMNGPVKKALNIPEKVRWGSQSNLVFNTLSEDFMKPVTDVVEKLLNETNVQVVVYSGQLDLICLTPATINWVKKLKWNGSEEFLKTKRHGISVNGTLEGYHKRLGNLNVYWISRAGHMAPADNPDGMAYVLQKTTGFGMEQYSQK